MPKKKFTPAQRVVLRVYDIHMKIMHSAGAQAFKEGRNLTPEETRRFLKSEAECRKIQKWMERDLASDRPVKLRDVALYPIKATYRRIKK